MLNIFDLRFVEGRMLFSCNGKLQEVVARTAKFFATKKGLFFRIMGEESIIYHVVI